jgi:hypothetical protein
MKNLGLLVTAGLLALGLTVEPAAGRRICRGPWQQWGMIAPGVRFGEFLLGSDGIERLKKLAKPDGLESGKSGTREVWKWADDERFFVHTVTKPSANGKSEHGVIVDLIGFSFPGQSTYKTFPSQISTGSTLEEIQKSFPDARPVATAPTVYDDVQQGIAFEFAKQPAADSPCIAIMVHLPGQTQVMTQEQVEALLKK